MLESFILWIWYLQTATDKTVENKTDLVVWFVTLLFFPTVNYFLQRKEKKWSWKRTKKQTQPSTIPLSLLKTMDFNHKAAWYTFNTIIPPPRLIMIPNVAYGTALSAVFPHLVIAYSRNPQWRFIALKVPMQPRNRLSFPIFQVTNNGLKRKEKYS